MRNIILLFVFPLLLTSCEEAVKGNGNVQKEDRQVDEFSELNIEGNFHVTISQGESPSVIIEADENLMQYIETEVRGDELRIGSDKAITNFRKLNAIVTVRKLSEIEISGACELIGSNELRSSDLKVKLSGSSEAELQLRCDKLDMELSGASKATLSGAAERFNLETSGSCYVKAFELRSRKCEIEMSGAGKADVFASNSLKINVSGASEIRYKGQPKDIDQQSSGASSISAYNEN